MLRRENFFCIVGSSGSGKSTLLRCLAAIDKDCKGQILIEGIGNKEYLSGKSIAFVSQDYSNFPWLTIRQNVQLGHPSSDESVVSATLKRLGLYKFQNYFPSRLSGGKRQRVAIARSLIQGTDIIYLTNHSERSMYKHVHRCKSFCFAFGRRKKRRLFL